MLAGTGTSTFSTTHQVGTRAIDLNGASNANGAYVVVPASLNAMGATTAVTIACWVNVTTARNWQRIWDFNNTSNTGYMFLTTAEQTNMRVPFRDHPDEQRRRTDDHFGRRARDRLAPHRRSARRRRHVHGDAVHRWPRRGTNAAMTLRPSSIGNTANNFIGKSAFTADPYFDGLVDDFRVYNRALTPAEITALNAFR
jgi:hypothetical protein